MSHEELKTAGLDAFLSNDGPRSVLIDADAPAVSTVSTVVSPLALQQKDSISFPVLC